MLFGFVLGAIILSVICACHATGLDAVVLNRDMPKYFVLLRLGYRLDSTWSKIKVLSLFAVYFDLISCCTVVNLPLHHFRLFLVVVFCWCLPG